MSGLDIIITITACLFESGLSPRPGDHHLRQELFVVIFTASCQQELNLNKPKVVKYQEKASTCPKNLFFMFNEMRVGQKKVTFS